MGLTRFLNDNPHPDEWVMGREEGSKGGNREEDPISFE